MVENILHNGKLFALIVKQNFNEPGINFFTDDDMSQQLAFMKHPEGKIIQPHLHNLVSRNIQNTQEVLFIRKGKLRVDFFSENKEFLESRILEEGDVILLIQGGHGFKVLEEVEMFEVKQGPYVGGMDKIKF